MIRLPLFLGTIVVCLAAAPNGPPLAQTPAPAAAVPLLSKDELPTAEQFADLARTDPLAMLVASMSRYRHEDHGYTCTLVKRERVNGDLGAEETIRVAFRESPFAVVMKWGQWPGLGRPVATLYAVGENDGQILARTYLGLTVPADPTGRDARRNSRFTIQDFGIARGTLRTYLSWKQAADRGKLNVEYLGSKPIPELNGRVCHVVRRTCDPAEIDAFSLAALDAKPTGTPKDAVRYATLMFDAETFLHVGSDLRNGDGSGPDTVVATYYFRDLRLNPAFDRDQFLPATLPKK